MVGPEGNQQKPSNILEEVRDLLDGQKKPDFNGAVINGRFMAPNTQIDQATIDKINKHLS